MKNNKPEKYFSLPDVAKQLGVSRNTVLNWKNRTPEQNPLVFIKLGNHWRISETNFEKWINKEQKQD